MKSQKELKKEIEEKDKIIKDLQGVWLLKPIQVLRKTLIREHKKEKKLWLIDWRNQSRNLREALSSKWRLERELKEFKAKIKKIIDKVSKYKSAISPLITIGRQNAINDIENELELLSKLKGEK